MRKEIEVKITSSGPSQINLENMNISDENLEEISEIALAIKTQRPDIENILLKENKIGDKGAAILAKEFSDLPKLTFLDLQYNLLSAAGIRTIMTLQKNHHDIVIALQGNKVFNVNEMNRIEETTNQFQPRK